MSPKDFILGKSYYPKIRDFINLKGLFKKVK